jgi:hypothetical protein
MHAPSFVFDITSDRAPGFRLQLEIAAASSLDDLHRAIAQHFALPADEPYSFYRSGRAFDERTEYGGPKTGSPRDARKTLLSRLALHPGIRMSHLQAEGADEHTVAFVRGSDSASGEPRVLETAGSLPTIAQFDRPRRLAEAEEWIDELHEIAGELAHVFAGDEGDEADPHADEDVEGDAELALRIARWARTRKDSLGVLELVADLDVIDWLLDLPRELAAQGQIDTALEIAREFAALTDRVHSAKEVDERSSNRIDALFASELGVLLAATEHTDEAKAVAAANLERFPRDEWVTLQAAQTFHLAGDARRAEESLRRVVGTTKHAGILTDSSELLAGLLRESGREADAKAVLDDLAVRAARSRGATGESETPVDDESERYADVERNDPCPCGSGKKFKKCHGIGKTRVESELDIFSRLFEDLVNFATREPAANEASAALVRFAGEDFAELSIAEAMPLLPDQSSEEAFVQFWLLDFEGERGTSAVRRYGDRKRHDLGRREREVLQRMQQSFVGLYSIDEISDDGRYLLRDRATNDARPFACRPLGDAFDGGVTIAGRVLELDGRPALLPGAKAFEDDAAVVAQCRAELAAWLKEHPSADAPAFFKASAHLFQRTDRND